MTIQRGRTLLFPQDGEEVRSKKGRKRALGRGPQTRGVTFINIKDRKIRKALVFFFNKAKHLLFFFFTQKQNILNSRESGYFLKYLPRIIQNIFFLHGPSG